MDSLKDWLETFWRVIFRPSRKTFLEEANKAEGKFGQGMFIIFLLGVYLQALLQAELGGEFRGFSGLAFVMFYPLIFLLYVFWVNTLYKKLFRRKRNNYIQIFYLQVAIISPLTVLNTLVIFFPRLNVVLDLSTVSYGIVLSVIALQALTDLKFWQATLAIVLSVILGALGFLCVPVLFFGIFDSVPILLR